MITNNKQFQDEQIKDLKQSQNNQIKEIKDLITDNKKSQINQIWALIGIVFTAILGFMGALAKMVFFPSP